MIGLRVHGVALLSALTAACLFAGQVKAGAIVDASTTGPGLGAVLFTDFATGDPNNDDYTGTDNSNYLTIEKVFDASDVIDTGLVAEASGGITEYQLSELVLNNTGDTWIAYVWELGTSSGGVFSPLPENIYDLQLDETGGDTSPFTALDSFSFNTLAFTGGEVGPGEVMSLSISLDVGDLVTNFVIRQYPIIAEVTVPEPAPLGLVLGGILFMGAAAIRRSRTVKPAFSIGPSR